ncbi:MAG: carboxypeptidase-like regulatory domain-containing protein, partial [Planctomycetota bacterium]
GLLPPARAGERWIVYALTADAFGFARLGLPAQTPEHAPLEIRLVPARTIRLRVLGAGEAPLSGVRVVLVPNHEPFPYERGHSALPLPPLLERCLVASTGDDGVATFARMPSPERREPWELMGYFVEVWRGTELLLRGEEMFPEVLEGELARLRVPADEELAVFGHVRDASGRELEGVRVRLLEGERELASRVSGPDGGFRLPHGPEVERVLTITAEDERAGRAEDHFDRGARMERYKPVELVLRPRLPIEGVVRDEQGQPLAGCFVSARPLGGDAACGAEAPSDLRGHFRIPEAYEGEFELMLALPYEFVETLRLPSPAPHVRGGDRSVEVVLAARAEQGCTLSIEARSANDAPLEVLALVVLSVEEPPPGNEPRRRLVAGGARVTGLAPGRHDLWVATTGGLAHEVVELTLPAEVRALVVRVEPTGRLRVRIDLGGMERPRSLLAIGEARSASGRIPGGRDYLAARVQEKPGEELELELTGLLAGTWGFWLYGEGLSPARVPVEVRAGEVHELVLVAAPGATLELDLSAWSTYEAVELSIRDEFGAPGLLTTLDPRRPASPWTLAPGAFTWSVKPWRAASPLVTGSLTFAPGDSARLVVPAPND